MRKKNFWIVALANMLLTMTVTILIVALPRWLSLSIGQTPAECGLTMGIFAIGLFCPGAFCSYLVQRYRRNIVFVVSALLLALSVAAPAVLDTSLWTIAHWLPLRLVQGCCFGLAQMVLTSTLIIDICDSKYRTRANYWATWFGRFALVLGPIVALLTTSTHDISTTLLIAGGLSVASAILVLTIHFPFRVPVVEPALFSSDRFFLISSLPLAILVFAVTAAFGMIMASPLSLNFYGLFAVGFVLALLSQRFVFPDTDNRSELVAGLLLMAAPQIILASGLTSPLTAPLLGLGLGIVGSRLLICFIKLSSHCQRGTLLSSFMLSWESGLATGVAVALAFSWTHTADAALPALSLLAAVLIIYVAKVHRWYVVHKNR